MPAADADAVHVRQIVAVAVCAKTCQFRQPRRTHAACARVVLDKCSQLFSHCIRTHHGLRAEALAAVARFRTRARTQKMANADELDRTYNEFFERAAKLLGRADYEKVFGVKSSEAPNLVDPTVARTSIRKTGKKRTT